MPQNNKPPDESPEMVPTGNQTADSRNWFIRLLMGLVELSVAFGVGWLVDYQFYEAVRNGHELSVAGVFVFLLALCAGVVAAIIFFWIVHARSNFKTWLILNVLVIGAIAIWLVRPLAQKDALRQERVAAQHQVEIDSDKRYAAWVEQLKISTNHGPPGAVPPMLKVEDDGTTIQVQNLAEKRVSLALGRVRQDPTAPDGWKWCGAYADRPPSRPSAVDLNPGEMAIFRLYENCAEEFKSAPIEYRVGGWRWINSSDEIGWWSDSAFTAVGKRN